jgi:hypothetical protein
MNFNLTKLAAWASLVPIPKQTWNPVPTGQISSRGKPGAAVSHGRIWNSVPDLEFTTRIVDMDLLGPSKLSVMYNNFSNSC